MFFILRFISIKFSRLWHRYRIQCRLGVLHCVLMIWMYVKIGCIHSLIMWINIILLWIHKLVPLLMMLLILMTIKIWMWNGNLSIVMMIIVSFEFAFQLFFHSDTVCGFE